MIVAELYMSTIQDRSIFYIPRYAADKKAYPSNNIPTTYYMLILNGPEIIQILEHIISKKYDLIHYFAKTILSYYYILY